MNITLTLTIEQLNVILRHLDQGKHAEVRQLMDIIITEANAQAQAAQQAPAEAPAAGLTEAE
jgi:hypothetical protein